MNERSGLHRIALAAAFAFLAVVYLLSTWRDLRRGPHVDEVEHLHTAARMARGERIYVDFAQHHSPLFPAALIPFVHEGNSVEAMRAYVTRARIAIALVAAIAIAAAAFVVWRAAGDPWTVVTFIGLVFAAGGVWRNGLGDIRPDTPALALWWGGAALALLAKRPAWRGLGLGLVFLAALVTPKWPLASLVIGVAFLLDAFRDRRGLAVAAIVAVLTAVAGLGVVALLTDLRLAAFHVIELTAAMVGSMSADGHHSAFYGCPLLLRPINVALAAVLVALGWLRTRHRLVAVLVAVAAASFCEILFLYPYPSIEPRYYTGWVFAAAAVLALAPRGVAALLPKAGPSLQKVAALLALVAALDVIGPVRPTTDSYWRSTEWLMARLRPGDTVWIGAWRHPIGVPDASYHWYGMKEVMPPTLRLAATAEGRRFLPPLGESDLPPCRVERGLDPNVRFLVKPMPTIPVAEACFERLIQRGAVLPTPVPEVWMVPRS